MDKEIGSIPWGANGKLRLVLKTTFMPQHPTLDLEEVRFDRPWYEHPVGKIFAFNINEVLALRKLLEEGLPLLSEALEQVNGRVGR